MNILPKQYTRTSLVRLTPAIYKRLTALSKEIGFPVAALIRACVDRALPYVENYARKKTRGQNPSTSKGRS
jgi:predicted DNA-binding protein